MVWATSACLIRDTDCLLDLEELMGVPFPVSCGPTYRC